MSAWKEKIKEFFEWGYWKIQHLREGDLTHHHYAYFYTQHFGFTLEDFKNKSILDIGCGPRGSLEWADNAERRTGLDPLACQYMQMQAQKHKMDYVEGYAEALPFEDESFDFVCSFNSIDHVRSMSKSCSEIKRVTKKGGYILIITDIHQFPTLTEPQKVSWSFQQEYFQEMQCLSLRKYRKTKLMGIYESIRRGDLLQNETPSLGVLSIKLKK